MKKDKALYIRVSQEEREALQQEAKKVSRSVSNFLLWLFAQFLDREEGKDDA